MELLTPHDLQRALLAKSAEIDEALDEFRIACLAWPDADRAARIARNTALLTAEGKSADIRMAKAEQAAEEPIYAEKMKGALKESAKSALNARLAQLNALQSLSSTVREEMRLAR